MNLFGRQKARLWIGSLASASISTPWEPRFFVFQQGGKNRPPMHALLRIYKCECPSFPGCVRHHSRIFIHIRVPAWIGCENSVSLPFLVRTGGIVASTL